MAPNQIGVSADRIVATVVNGIEVARYGGLKTEHNPSPYRVEPHEPMYRLRHYFPESRRQRPPVVLAAVPDRRCVGHFA